MRTLRKNTIDAFSSRQFMLNDALPSVKHAMAIEYEQFSYDRLTRLSAELALPFSTQANGRSANYIKFEAKHN